MTLALSILFEGVLDRDWLVHEELRVHGFDSRVCGFEVRVGHEPVTFRLPRLWIACNLIGYRVSEVVGEATMGEDHRLTFAVVAIIPNVLNVS
jgi:hypothetical protein